MTTFRLPSVSSGPRGLRFSDYIDGAKELGCSIAALKAVGMVESEGEGFLLDGRPKISFEAHWFSGLTKHRFDADFPNISSMKANKRLARGGAGEYPRLQQALALDPMAAVAATRWGRFQMPGKAYGAAFDTLGTFVKAMYQSEIEQLDAFIALVKKKGLDTHLRIGDMAGFAAGYNPEAAQKAGYVDRLDSAYRRMTRA